MSVMDQLATMPAKDLRELVSRARFLLDPTGKGSPATSGSEELPKAYAVIWAEVSDALRKLGDGPPPPLNVVLKTRHGSLARSACETVDELIRKSFRARRAPEVLKIVRLLVELSSKELAARGRLDLFALLHRLKESERLVDRHFPGYRVMGMLPMLVRAHRVA